MRAADRRHTGSDRGAEGDELDRIGARPIGPYHREVDMRVDPGIPMPREVFGYSEDTMVLETSDMCGREVGYQFGVGAITPRIDAGVRGVVVDIDDGREDHADPDRARFDVGDATAYVGGGR